MLPRSEIDIYREVDLGAVMPPTRNDVESGVLFIRGHLPWVFAEASSWAIARDVLRDEREAVEETARKATSGEEFEDLAFEEAAHFGLELGIEAAVAALCAAGCVTSASCRGHPHAEHTWSPCPVVVFAADRRRAELLLACAEAAGCGFSHAEGGGLQVWAPSVTEMFDLAEAVIARAAEFDALPDRETISELRQISAAADWSD